MESDTSSYRHDLFRAVAFARATRSTRRSSTRRRGLLLLWFPFRFLLRFHHAYNLQDISGIEFMIAIRTEFPNARFVIVSSFAQDNEIRRALAHGAQAYLLKSVPSSELVEVIRQVHAGKRKIPASIAAQLAEQFTDEMLSDREVEALRHLLYGNRNRDIAERLFIAEQTVKSHMKHIMHKLGANDRTQALAIALRRGLVQL